MAQTALQLTQKDLIRFRESAERQLAQAKKHSQKAETVTKTVIRTTVATASAAAFGFAQGRVGRPIKYANVPVELLFGLGTHIAGFAGLAGSASEYLHAAGDGALCNYAATVAVGYGVRMRAESLKLAKAEKERELEEAKKKENADAETKAPEKQAA